MIKRVISLLTITAFVASCGADGMPTRPEAKSETPEEIVEIAAPAAQL